MSVKRKLIMGDDMVMRGYVPASDYERLEAALKEIATSKFLSYAHSPENHMYDGQYGIGVTDGHRYCAKIARAALDPS